MPASSLQGGRGGQVRERLRPRVDDGDAAGAGVGDVGALEGVGEAAGDGRVAARRGDLDGAGARRCGAVPVSEVPAPLTTMLVPGTPLNVTLALVRFVPVSVKAMPPEGAPKVGERAVTVGAPA